MPLSSRTDSAPPLFGPASIATGAGGGRGALGLGRLTRLMYSTSAKFELPPLSWKLPAMNAIESSPGSTMLPEVTL